MAEATTAADIMAEAGIMGIMAEAITMEAIITADHGGWDNDWNNGWGGWGWGVGPSVTFGNPYWYSGYDNGYYYSPYTTDSVYYYQTTPSDDSTYYYYSPQ